MVLKRVCEDLKKEMLQNSKSGYEIFRNSE